jgi:hypothetical protein
MESNLGEYQHVLHVEEENSGLTDKMEHILALVIWKILTLKIAVQNSVMIK